MIHNKNRYNKSLAFIFLSLLFISPIACTKNFDEINTPSNTITASSLNVNVLGQAWASDLYYGLCAGSYQQSQNLYADVYSQYFATSQPSFNADQFLEVGAWTNTAWNTFYQAASIQKVIEDFTEANALPLQNAMAKVWRVTMYHRATDYWGPIIYSKFGVKASSVPYDSQKDIYMDFFKTLDDATAVLKANAGKNVYGQNDLIYGGSADKWLKFANTLRLRLAMRIAYVEPAIAKTQAEKAVADGVIAVNADNANVSSSVNSINWLSIWTYIDEFRMSASMESVLKGYNDPRLTEYFRPAATVGGYHGLRNGYPANLKNSALNGQYSFVGDKWLSINRAGTTTPNKITCAAEAFFLRAEGALRGWNMGGTALEFYNTGIRMSLTERTSATTTQIEAYILSTATPAALVDPWNSPPMSNIPVAFETAGTFERRLEQIITQKWISLYPDGWEAWSERRRTGYPKGYPLINSLNPDISVKGKVRRLSYTTGEIATNGAAVEAARKLLGGADNMTTRLWWDANPNSKDLP
jgi:hypothetical protein